MAHMSEPRHTKCLEETKCKTIVTIGVFLLSCTIIFSESALERLKLAYLRSFPTAAGQIAQGQSASLDPAVQNLIASLKIATAREVAFSSTDRRRWEWSNRCKSRQELKLRYEHRTTVQNIDTPLGLTVLMHAYENLHRTCIQTSGNLTELFHSGKGGGRCQFLVAEAGNGLGNRVLWMVSTLMYAILARRVLLIDPRSRIPSLMCEPFPGSSWVAPPDFPFADLRPDLWQSTNDFFATMDIAKLQSNKDLNVSGNAVRGDDSFGPTSRFYCRTEQFIYSKMRWMTLGGCLYFLPKLFAIPAFKPVLESLFYNKTPLTNLLRLSMLPVDPIWAKVRMVEDKYLKQADRLVGVHVRYRGGYGDFLNLHETVNHIIKSCMADNNILSMIVKPSNSSGGIPKRASPPRRTVLFISSLYRSLYNDFSGINSQMPTSGEEVVELVQLSSEGDQLSGLEIDGRALVEILCLSFSDQLLTSSMSTYSELAHAYGGLKPWVINSNDRVKSNDVDIKYPSQVPCMRATAMDGCYQDAGVFYFCPMILIWTRCPS